MGKDERLHFRLNPEARQRLQRACELTGLDEATALRACIQAFIEHIEESGGIWLPLAIIPKSNAPPGKAPAGGEQRTAGRTDVGAASGGSRLPATPSASAPGLNEDTPQEIPPAIPARDIAPRMTKTRAALRKMAEQEGGKK